MNSRAFATAAAALVLAACGGGGGGNYSSNGSNGTTSPPDQNPAPTAPNTINANPALLFNPTSLTVAKGATVTFNFGSVGHNVTFTTAGSPANIPTTSGASVDVVFPTAGTFAFHCTIHPTYMNGTITVQ